MAKATCINIFRVPYNYECYTLSLIDIAEEAPLFHFCFLNVIRRQVQNLKNCSSGRFTSNISAHIFREDQEYIVLFGCKNGEGKCNI